MYGFGMVVLGALLDVRAGCVRCPEMKRKWMLHAAGQMREAARESAMVEARLLEHLTGRATNSS